MKRVAREIALLAALAAGCAVAILFGYAVGLALR